MKNLLIEKNHLVFTVPSVRSGNKSQWEMLIGNISKANPKKYTVKMIVVKLYSILYSLSLIDVNHICFLKHNFEFIM